VRRYAKPPDPGHARTPELVDDHRFAGGIGSTRRACEVIRATDGFHEQQDRFGVRIIDQTLGDFADAEIAFITDGNQFREADAAAEAA